MDKELQEIQEQILVFLDYLEDRNYLYILRNNKDVKEWAKKLKKASKHPLYSKIISLLKDYKTKFIEE